MNVVRGGRIALTFDDGPNPDADTTIRLPDILRRGGNVKATIFLIGAFVDAQPDLAREISAQGHAIGNHTFTHPNLTGIGPAAVVDELQSGERAIDRALGKHRVTGSPFRAPYLRQV